MNESPASGRIQFSLRSLLILVTGVAIGLALAVGTRRFVAMLPSEARRASLAPYVIEPPDVLTVQLLGDHPAAESQVSGEHLVTPDGTIALGALGRVGVAGKTIEDARRAIEGHLSKEVASPQVVVRVLAYNSSVYYVIVEAPGRQAVHRLPITGHETVLDAVSGMGSPIAGSVGSVRIVRPSGTSAPAETIRVDWRDVTRGGSASANYQIFPGDRVFISCNR